MCKLRPPHKVKIRIEIRLVFLHQEAKNYIMFITIMRTHFLQGIFNFIEIK